MSKIVTECPPYVSEIVRGYTRDGKFSNSNEPPNYDESLGKPILEQIMLGTSL